jgi:hypothetical protein
MELEEEKNERQGPDNGLQQVKDNDSIDPATRALIIKFEAEN